jgi:D-beta-D-heptose 7-phosphate kinase/D-beta-D-heptose 1-phosphate adenosyltransferase
MKVVIATGGFDPIHSGHIEYLKCAAQLGDVLIVGLNSDAWLERKKGRAFMSVYEREQIISNLSFVHNVIGFDDWDDTAIECILKVKRFYPKADIVFANGGDRTIDNIPEQQYFKADKWIKFEFGVGGSDKKNSSSGLLEKWVDGQTERPWGYYRVLHNELGVVKVKELVVMPGQRLSMQKHQHRAEHWFISKGVATLYTIDENSTDFECLGEYKMFDNVHIERNQWHQLANQTESPLKIIEIQYGTECIEDDIVRQDDTVST